MLNFAKSNIKKYNIKHFNFTTMSHEIVKQFISQDGHTRLSIFRDYYAENPRDLTDFPLHCEDWSRAYSIMSKGEREYKSRNAMFLLQDFLKKYGNQKKIISLLKQEYKKEGHSDYINALEYEATRHEWMLVMWQPGGKAYGGYLIESEWEEQIGWIGKQDNIDFYELIDELSEETIDFLIENNCLGDGVKICSYSFGYNGEVSFSDIVSSSSEGIAYIEKKEYLKYTGRDEDFWKDATLNMCTGLFEDIKAWSNGEVYGFILEETIHFHIHKDYPNNEREAEDYDDVEWETIDSCYGYYGDITYCISDAMGEEEFESMKEISINK